VAVIPRIRRATAPAFTILDSHTGISPIPLGQDAARIRVERAPWSNQNGGSYG